MKWASQEFLICVFLPVSANGCISETQHGFVSTLPNDPSFTFRPWAGYGASLPLCDIEIDNRLLYIDLKSNFTMG